MKVLSFLTGLLFMTVAPFGNGIFSGCIVPVFGSYGLSILEFFFLGVSFIVILFNLSHGRGISLRDKEYPVFFSLILLTLSRLISLLFASFVPIATEQFFSILRFPLIIIFIYSASCIFEVRDNRKMFFLGVLFAVIIESAGGLITFFVFKQKGLFFSNAMFPMQTFLVIVLLFMGREFKKYWFIIPAILFIIVAIIASLARSAWIFFFSALVIQALVGFRLRRVFYPKSLLFICAGLIICSFVTFPLLRDAAFARFENAVGFGGSLQVRVFLWDKALGAFMKSPLKGIGSGGFSRNVMRLPNAFGFQSGVDAALEDHLLSGLGGHNMFFEVLSETGLIGLSSYIFWIYALISLSHTVIKRADEKKDYLVISMAVIVLSCLVNDFYGRNSFAPVAQIFIGAIMGFLREEDNNKESKAMTKPGSIKSYQ